MSVIGNPDLIQLARMVTLRSALKLEVLGMKHSRGSVYARIKREFKLSGTKARVLDQFSSIVDKMKQERGL